jgi:hypothetical protein
MDLDENKSVLECLRELFATTIAFGWVLGGKYPKLRMRLHYLLCFYDVKLSVVIE